MSGLNASDVDRIEAAAKQYQHLSDPLGWMSAQSLALVVALRAAWDTIANLEVRETAYTEFVASLADDAGIKIPLMFQARLKHLQTQHGEQISAASDEATGEGG